MPKEDTKKTANKNVNKTKKDKRHFFKDLKAELKRVIWPTPKQLVNNTVAVITIVLITALIVFVLDFTFEKLNTYGIEKIKSAIETTNEVNNEVSNGVTNETADGNVSTDENQENTNTATSENETVNE